ncbi:PepSY domain-containing protein [Rhodoferax sp.]|uniref:PepSY domain-containing protein n=1 Tax=Rhodoferax sp. TaxID=50421 RepID=UPI0026268EF9|nr:PepSY domain-containing protein [Rhodoferax sp.]MDD2926551.1 PepSY domain-containing protein [Rhodoferax sp.]
MKQLSTLFSFVLAASALTAASAWITPASADDNRARWDAGPSLPVAQVVQKLAAAGYQNIEKIQLKNSAYEVRATGRQGERIKLYVNAQTGELMDRRQSERLRGDDDARYTSGDCNKRRCRDDLVPTPLPLGTGGR